MKNIMCMFCVFSLALILNACLHSGPPAVFASSGDLTASVPLPQLDTPSINCVCNGLCPPYKSNNYNWLSTTSFILNGVVCLLLLVYAYLRKNKVKRITESVW